MSCSHAAKCTCSRSSENSSALQPSSRTLTGWPISESLVAVLPKMGWSRGVVSRICAERVRRSCTHASSSRTNTVENSFRLPDLPSEENSGALASDSDAPDTKSTDGATGARDGASVTPSARSCLR